MRSLVSYSWHFMQMCCFSLAVISFADLKYGWQIISPNKSFAVYAATATEKAEWMAHINKCINDLRKKSKWLIRTFCVAEEKHPAAHHSWPVICLLGVLMWCLFLLSVWH